MIGRIYRATCYQIEGGLTASTVSVRFRIPGETWLKRQIVAMLETASQEHAWELTDAATIQTQDIINTMSKALDGLTFVNDIGKVDMFVIADESMLPEGYLPCNGDTFLAEDYPDLFAVLPSFLKGTDDFTTPVMSARSPIGVGTSEHGINFLVGENSGADRTNISVSQLPSHNHSIPGFFEGVAEETVGVPVPVLIPYFDTVTGDTGDGDPVEIVHPVTGVIYGILAR